VKFQEGKKKLSDGERLTEDAILFLFQKSNHIMRLCTTILTRCFQRNKGKKFDLLYPSFMTCSALQISQLLWAGIISTGTHREILLP
jgi:hypothetical protein